MKSMNIPIHMSTIRVIIMVILSAISPEHIALSYKKWCEHKIRKNQQIKSTVHDAK